MLSASPQCAVHPDRPSAGVCSRCGRFLCDGCRAPAQVVACLECVPRLEPHHRVRFAPFALGTSLGFAVALLRGTWARLLVVLLPFGIGAGALSAYATPELDPRHPADAVWGFYGAMLLQVAYAVLVGLLGHLAAVAVVVGYAEGRQVSVDDAFTEAARAWLLNLLDMF